MTPCNKCPLEDRCARRFEACRVFTVYAETGTYSRVANRYPNRKEFLQNFPNHPVRENPDLTDTQGEG